MNGRPWPPAEDDALRAFFASPQGSFADLASTIDRSIDSVRQRAHILNLRLSTEARSEIGRARWERVPVEKRRAMGQHLIALKQQQKHQALSTGAPPWCMMVRAAVEQRFGGDHRTAAVACRRSPDDRPIHPNHLWEIIRGWKYVYITKKDQRVREQQPILYPSRKIVDRLCAGLPRDPKDPDKVREFRGKLLAALEASGGFLLEERRSEIVKRLDRPLREITNPYERKAKKQQIARSAEARRGRKNPKNQARLREWWDGLKRDPEVIREVAPALAQFHHPSPTGRMLRGWKILGRRGRAVSSADTKEFVRRWANRLGVTLELVQRFVDKFRGIPHGGKEPDLDLYLSIRDLKSSRARLTWPTIARMVAREKDPEVIKRQYLRFARANFQPVKPHPRPKRH